MLLLLSVGHSDWSEAAKGRKFAQFEVWTREIALSLFGFGSDLMGDL